MSVNKVILVGNVGGDPAIRYDASGNPIANFSVACSESYKDKDGNKQERTEWVRIVLFGKQAGVAEQYVHKGDPLYVEGRLQTREWTNKEGQKVTTTEVVGERIQLLGRKGDNPRPAQEPAKANGYQEEIDPDEIPF